MKARYISQRGENDCGPVAVFNLIRWAGGKINVTPGLSRLGQMCLPLGPEFGASAPDITTTLSHVKRGLFSFSYRKRPTLLQIEEHLKCGGAIYVIHPNEVGLHASLLIGVSKDGRSFGGVNTYEGEANSKIQRKVVRSWARYSNTVAWFVTRIKQVR